MNDILITGSRGFIGTAIRETIKYPYDEIDLLLGTDHKDIVSRAGILICLSAWVRQDESFKHPGMYISNNVGGLCSLIENNSFDGIIFPSSSTVYDRYGNLNPVSPYGLTKLIGENLIKMYFNKYWILRLSNPYGRHDTRSIFWELMKCKNEKRIFKIYTSQKVVRDYFHVSHVANIVNDILNGNLCPGIYNVGTGEGIYVAEFMKQICEKYNIEYECVESPEGLLDGFIPKENLLKAEKHDLEAEWISNYLE